MTDEGVVVVFRCPYEHGEHECEHSMDGPWVEFDEGRGGSATCSRCGITEIDHMLGMGL